MSQVARINGWPGAELCILFSLVAQDCKGHYPPSQGPADVEAGLVGWGGLSTGARVSPGQDTFILWYQVGEQSPVVVGGSVVVGGAVRE